MAWAGFRQASAESAPGGRYGKGDEVVTILPAGVAAPVREPVLRIPAFAGMTWVYPPRLQPGSGGWCRFASGISRLSFLAKLRRHTSLSPSGPGV